MLCNVYLGLRDPVIMSLNEFPSKLFAAGRALNLAIQKSGLKRNYGISKIPEGIWGKTWTFWDCIWNANCNFSLLFLSLRLRYVLVHVNACYVLRELMDNFERHEMYEEHR